MPKLASSSLPKYRRHRASSQAIVTLDGRDFYLGPHGSAASKAMYDRLTGEWLAGGRRLPPREQEQALTIAELVTAFWILAQQRYRKHGEPTKTLDNIRLSLRPLRELYVYKFVAIFGPLALKSIQQTMIERNVSRGVINSRIGTIKRVFKWAVSEQLVPSGLFHALQTVAGIQRGRTNARESPPVRPVDDVVVKSTLPYLPPVFQTLVNFQRLTGCRPGEVCLLRPCDVDTAGEVWRYAPESHKTEHHGRERVIFVGPKAQDILRPYLLRDKVTYCFVPAEAERERNAVKRASRQSPMTPSQSRRRAKRKRSRPPGERYTANSYRRAVHRACALAFPPPVDLPEDEQKEWRKAHQWHPNRLRHSAATLIRQRFGLEAAQVTLGHASADVSQIYAERDYGLAAKIAKEVG
jgi:integrase